MAPARAVAFQNHHNFIEQKARAQGMTESALAAGPALSDPESRAALFASLEATLTARGAPELIDRLIAHLDEKSEYRALLDALLLKARYQLGLPTFTTGSLSALPEPERTQYEEKYVDAIRLVGSRYLDAGDIPTAWAYFRAIAENEPVARGDPQLPAHRGRRAIGSHHRSRLQSRCRPGAWIRAHSGALWHVPGDHGF